MCWGLRGEDWVFALASECAIPLRAGEGEPRAARDARGPQDGGAAPVVSPDEAEAGMALMSALFKETGSKLYVGAGAREHD